jgi:DNA polymerase IV
MDPSSGGYSPSNPNARTIQVLEEMSRHYDQMQDQWRTLAYRKGVTTLKKQTTKISTAKQAAALPFIGQRLADKIEEIVLTNRLRKLDNTKDDPLDSVLRLFLGVYGAGLVQANKWIQAGHRTLDDLLAKAKLTESHKIGIEHYSDFNSRIPRPEVAAHGAVVINALKKIDPKFQTAIMGSYRRGAKDSGDIDMIITCPGATLSTLRTVVFESLVSHLYSTNFLKASLATSRSKDPTGTKWHGASCLPSSSVWRRLDFLLVPEEEMGAALIYFTGNDIFNRSMRLLARKKNMRLNQKGLYKDVKRGMRGEKFNEDVLVEGRSERRIFEVLGVPWREPEERIC